MSKIRLRRPSQAQSGQSLVEFALVVPLFVLLLLAIAAFSIAFEKKIALDNAARSGARYAAVFPDHWSNANPAPSGTIQGMIQAEGSTLTLPNDNAHIQIAYLIPQTSGPAIECGYYDPTANSGAGGFVPETNPGTGAAYTEAECLAALNMVQVTLTTTYPIPVPILSALWPNGLTIKTSATMMEEQGQTS